MKFWSLLATVSLFSAMAHAGLGKYPTRFQVAHQRLAPMSENLAYYGGPVISNAHVVAVFWGEGVDATVEKDIGGMYAAAVNSTHMANLPSSKKQKILKMSLAS